MPRRTIQLSAARRDRLPAREKNIEQRLVDALPDPNRRRALRKEERDAAYLEAARRALDERFKSRGLKGHERGALVALWSDIEGQEIEDIAEHFGMTPDALRKAKERSSALFPCETFEREGSCRGDAHCVHVHGREVLHELANDLAVLIIDEVENELGPE